MDDWKFWLLCIVYVVGMGMIGLQVWNILTPLPGLKRRSLPTPGRKAG